MPRWALVVVLGCTSRVDEAEKEAIAKRDQVIAEHDKALIEARARADKEKTERAEAAGRLPQLLAKLAADPTAIAAKPVTGTSLTTWTYDVPSFKTAQLRQVVKHPEAWSWWLEGADGITVGDFGPVRDLLGGAAPIGGFSVGGVIHRVDAGPLAGAIVLAGPDGKSFSVSSVAYHRLSPTSMIMPALCDLGAVDGVPADGSIKFKDACFAEIAKKAGKPETELFPKSWMERVGTDDACKHSYGTTIGGRAYECSDATGKLVVKVRAVP